MNTQQATNLGYAILCSCAFFPFLAGIGITLLVQARISSIGKPWAFIPGGKHFKKLWETYLQ